MKNPKISKLKLDHKIGNHYTSFQKDVFVAVGKIPLGQTKSYQGLGVKLDFLMEVALWVVLSVKI